MRDLAAARTAGPFPHEGDGGGEDAATLLARLHGPRGEGATVPDQLDVEEDGELGRAGEKEVAVHGVDEEVSGHGLLGGSETHGDHGAAVDTAGAGGMPWLAGIGEDVLVIVLVGKVRYVVFVSRLTGAMTASSVTSKEFSIAALLGSSGGGLMSVGRAASFDSSSGFPIAFGFSGDAEM